MKTVKDIAKILHVSPSTVSKALSGSNDISEQTKKLVIDYARENGYMPRKYHASEKGTLAVLLGDIDVKSNEQFGYEIILGFQIAASAAGYNVTLHTMTPETQNTPYSEFMREKSYVGAFLLGQNNNDLRMKEIRTTVYPTVLLDNFIDNPKIAYVGTDNYVGYDIVLRHLVHLGHTRIAFLNGEDNSMVSLERKNAYKAALSAHGLHYDAGLFKSGDYFKDCSEQAVQQFLANGATAILCASDVIASYVYNRLIKIGVKVPEDVSLIGYDDLPVSQYLGITTLAQNRLDLGKIAFTVLNDLINGVSINKLTLRPKLVVRNTTASVKTK